MYDSPVMRLYLDLLKRCLIGTLHVEKYRPLRPIRGGLRETAKNTVNDLLQAAIAPMGYEIVRRLDPAHRAEGEDWPAEAETMIGAKRLDNLQKCIESVHAENIPGDVIECGVWRGGATIFMRALLMLLGDEDRKVWVADSFEGLPPPDAANFKADAGSILHHYQQLAVSLEEVQANFARYGMLDDRVKFLKGFFKDTLANSPIEQLSVLRADGDMYESTIQILDGLYPKLSVGGYCIIDDYGAVPVCQQATDDFRMKNGITEPLQSIDYSGVFWRRGR